MQQFFASGHAVDFVIGVIVVEMAILLWLGHSLRCTLLLLLPAVFILLGLRAALVGAPWPWIAVPLMLSLPVHLADVFMRHQRRLQD
jgi:hypothetical protein